MSASSRQRQAPEPHLVADGVTGLAALSLSNEHLSELAQQGFVALEYRRQRDPFFKLRFRFKGRQVVRYLGKNADVAENIRQEVLALQTQQRLTQELRRLTVQAQKVLRQTKLDLQGKVEEAGFAFHGFAIRKKTRRGGDKSQIQRDSALA